MSDLQPPSPWWLGVASTIVVAMAGAIAKLWRENVTLRREALASARETTERITLTTSAHLHDLHKVIGWPRSIDPPAPVIRDKPPRPRSPRK
jgi:hypothetical protein